jgi:hypothetical protein
MLMVKTADQIRTGGTIKGFRACRSSTGVSMAHVASVSIVLRQAALAGRLMRRLWLIAQHLAHRGRAGLTVPLSSKPAPSRPRERSGATRKGLH